MAEKPRVKAPQQRSSLRPAVNAARRRRLYLLGAGTVLAALVIAIVVAIAGFGAGGGATVVDVRTKVAAAGGRLRELEAQPGKHSLGADATADWNTDPPTSGPHFGFDARGSLGTVIWGAYAEPVQLARVVHNLEHGGIYILYGNEVPPRVVAELRDFYDRRRNGTILAPYPKLGDEIALGAWVVRSEEDEKGYVARLKKFDQGAFETFFRAFQFKGPERIPGSALLPGGS